MWSCATSDLRLVSAATIHQHPTHLCLLFSSTLLRKSARPSTTHLSLRKAPTQTRDIVLKHSMFSLLAAYFSWSWWAARHLRTPKQMIDTSRGYALKTKNLSGKSSHIITSPPMTSKVHIVNTKWRSTILMIIALESADLIHRMLEADPSKRIRLPEIHSHAWMQGQRVVDFLPGEWWMFFGACLG